MNMEPNICLNLIIEQNFFKQSQPKFMLMFETQNNSYMTLEMDIVFKVG